MIQQIIDVFKTCGTKLKAIYYNSSVITFKRRYILLIIMFGILEHSLQMILNFYHILRLVAVEKSPWKWRFICSFLTWSMMSKVIIIIFPGRLSGSWTFFEEVGGQKFHVFILVFTLRIWQLREGLQRLFLIKGSSRSNLMRFMQNWRDHVLSSVEEYACSFCN